MRRFPQARHLSGGRSGARSEPCATVCRVAPSFLRVGHVELHSRRARKGGDQALGDLRAIVDHAVMRECAAGAPHASSSVLLPYAAMPL